MKAYLKIVDVINRIVGYVLGTLIGIMSILIILQIFTRFVINYPLHWTEELARYLMIYSVFLGAALALRQGRLIAIEFVSQSVTEKWRKLLKKIVMIFTIIFSLLLIVQGMNIIPVVHNQASAGLGIPMSFAYFAIPLGATVMLLNAIAILMEKEKKINDEESEDEITWQQ